MAARTKLHTPLSTDDNDVSGLFRVHYKIASAAILCASVARSDAGEGSRAITQGASICSGGLPLASPWRAEEAGDGLLPLQ